MLYILLYALIIYYNSFRLYTCNCDVINDMNLLYHILCSNFSLIFISVAL